MDDPWKKNLAWKKRHPGFFRFIWCLMDFWAGVTQAWWAEWPSPASKFLVITYQLQISDRLTQQRVRSLCVQLAKLPSQSKPKDKEEK